MSILRRKGIKKQSDKVRYKIEPRYRKLKISLIEKRHVTGCELCGRRTPYLDCHHILARSLGGRIDEPYNLVFLCRTCHDLQKPSNEEKRSILLEKVKKLNVKYGIGETWIGSNEP